MNTVDQRDKKSWTKLLSILDTTTALGTQNEKHWFLVNKIGLTETEYLECLNKATNGELVRNLWN